MSFEGIVQGNRIELDEPLPYVNGTRVSVDVRVREGAGKGSPAALLRLAGSLTPEEAVAILNAAQESRRIDESLWARG